jgi:hypothetical protein
MVSAGTNFGVERLGTAQRLGRTGTSNAIGELRASTILNEYGEARSELIGKAVVLTDGKAGTVENVWLDELHGLRIFDRRS